MAFGNGGRCHVWAIGAEERGFLNVNLTSNSKDKNGEWYKTFSSQYVQFLGKAKEKIKGVQIPEKGLPIILKDIVVENCYKDKEGNYKYLKNFRTKVFDFDWVEGEEPKSGSNANDFVETDVNADNIPFE